MPYSDILLFVGRVLFGGYFVLSGLNHFMHLGMMKGYAQSKGVPMPDLAVVVTGLLLFLGGLGVLLGAWVPWALLLLVIFLVPTTLMMHRFWSVQDAQMKMGEQINFMKNVGLIGAVLMMFSLATPWMYSIGL